MPRAHDPTGAGAARRDLLVAILRLKSPDPLTVGDVLEECRRLHEQGQWPQAEWVGAKNEPYHTGVRQHLDSLAFDGRIMGGEYVSGRGRVYWYAAPEDLLPDPPDRVQAILDAYRAETGLEALVGVTQDLQRVVRVQTARGVYEVALGGKDDWLDGLREAGLT